MWDLHTDLHTVIMINNTATPWQTGEEFREGPGAFPTSLLPSQWGRANFLTIDSLSCPNPWEKGRWQEAPSLAPFCLMPNLGVLQPSVLFLPEFELLCVLTFVLQLDS